MRAGSVGRHGAFDLLVEAEREALHFGEVTPALLRGHDLADFAEVLEHRGLALGAKSGDFSEHLPGG